MIKQIEKKVGIDLNGDGIIGSGRGYVQGHGAVADGMINSGSVNHGQQHNHFGPHAIPPNHNQHSGSSSAHNYGHSYLGNSNPFGGGEHKTNPYHSSAGGGGLVKQLGKMTGMNLNGDGGISSSHGHSQGDRGTNDSGVGHVLQNNYSGHPSYASNYNQYGSPSGSHDYDHYGGSNYSLNLNTYGRHEYGQSSHQSGGGDGLIDRLEKVNAVDLNGDGCAGSADRSCQFDRNY